MINAAVSIIDTIFKKKLINQYPAGNPSNESNGALFKSQSGQRETKMFKRMTWLTHNFAFKIAP